MCKLCNYSALRAVVPNLFGPRDRFRGRQFFQGLGARRDGFRVIQACYIYRALQFYYYYYISSNSEHQT